MSGRRDYRGYPGRSSTESYNDRHLQRSHQSSHRRPDKKHGGSRQSLLGSPENLSEINRYSHSSNRPIRHRHGSREEFRSGRNIPATSHDYHYGEPDDVQIHSNTKTLLPTPSEIVEEEFEPDHSSHDSVYFTGVQERRIPLEIPSNEHEQEYYRRENERYHQSKPEHYHSESEHIQSEHEHYQSEARSYSDYRKSAVHSSSSKGREDRFHHPKSKHSVNRKRAGLLPVPHSDTKDYQLDSSVHSDVPYLSHEISDSYSSDNYDSRPISSKAKHKHAVLLPTPMVEPVVTLGENVMTSPVSYSTPSTSHMELSDSFQGNDYYDSPYTGEAHSNQPYMATEFKNCDENRDNSYHQEPFLSMQPNESVVNKNVETYEDDDDYVEEQSAAFETGIMNINHPRWVQSTNDERNESSQSDSHSNGQRNQNVPVFDYGHKSEEENISNVASNESSTGTNNNASIPLTKESITAHLQSDNISALLQNDSINSLLESDNGNANVEQMMEQLNLRLELIKVLEGMQNTMNTLNEKVKKAPKGRVSKVKNTDLETPVLCDSKVSSTECQITPSESKSTTSSVPSNECCPDSTDGIIDDDIEIEKPQHPLFDHDEDNIISPTNKHFKGELFHQNEHSATSAVKQTDQIEEGVDFHSHENEVELPAASETSSVHEEPPRIVLPDFKLPEIKAPDSTEEPNKAPHLSGSATPGGQALSINHTANTLPHAHNVNRGGMARTEYKTYREWRLAKQRMNEQLNAYNNSWKNLDSKPSNEAKRSDLCDKPKVIDDSNNSDSGRNTNQERGSSSGSFSGQKKNMLSPKYDNRQGGSLASYVVQSSRGSVEKDQLKTKHDNVGNESKVSSDIPKQYQSSGPLKQTNSSDSDTVKTSDYLEKLSASHVHNVKRSEHNEKDRRRSSEEREKFNVKQGNENTSSHNIDRLQKDDSNKNRKDDHDKYQKIDQDKRKGDERDKNYKDDRDKHRKDYRDKHYKHYSDKHRSEDRYKHRSASGDKHRKYDHDKHRREVSDKHRKDDRSSHERDGHGKDDCDRHRKDDRDKHPKNDRDKHSKDERDKHSNDDRNKHSKDDRDKHPKDEHDKHPKDDRDKHSKDERDKHPKDDRDKHSKDERDKHSKDDHDKHSKDERDKDRKDDRDKHSKDDHDKHSKDDHDKHSKDDHDKDRKDDRNKHRRDSTVKHHQSGHEDDKRRTDKQIADKKVKNEFLDKNSENIYNQKAESSQETTCYENDSSTELNKSENLFSKFGVNIVEENKDSTVANIQKDNVKFDHSMCLDKKYLKVVLVDIMKDKNALKKINELKQSANLSIPKHSVSASKAVSSEKESLSEKFPSEGESVSKKLPLERESISRTLPSEKDSVSKKLTSEGESVSKKLQSGGESVSKKLPSGGESNFRKLPLERESVSKKLPSERESVSKKLPSERESVSKKAPLERQSFFEKLSADTKPVSKNLPSERKKLFPETDNIFEKLSESNYSSSSSFDSKPVHSKAKILKKATDVKKSSSAQDSHIPQKSNNGQESSSSEDSDDLFAKIDSILNKDKKKKYRPISLHGSSKQGDYHHKQDKEKSSNHSKSETEQKIKSVDQSIKKKQRSVKYLRRVNKVLYWRSYELKPVRVRLKRLCENDIREMKLTVKKDFQKAQENRLTPKDLPNVSNKKRPKIDPILQGDRIGKSLADTKDQTLGNTNRAETKNVKISTSESESDSSVFKETLSEEKHHFERCNSKDTEERVRSEKSDKYKRIIFSIQSTSETSESEFERKVLVSQRERVSPVISEDCVSENLEGSLGSDDGLGGLEDINAFEEENDSLGESDTNVPDDDISLAVDSNHENIAVKAGNDIISVKSDDDKITAKADNDNISVKGDDGDKDKENDSASISVSSKGLNITSSVSDQWFPPHKKAESDTCFVSIEIDEIDWDAKSDVKETSASKVSKNESCSAAAKKHVSRKRDYSSDSSDDEHFTSKRIPHDASHLRSSKTMSDTKGRDHTSVGSGSTGKKYKSKSVCSTDSILRFDSFPQFDGHSDPFNGESTASSGDEGDVEDNSEDESSSSQDLFADVHEGSRLISSSVKPSQCQNFNKCSNSMVLIEEDKQRNSDNHDSSQSPEKDTIGNTFVAKSQKVVEADVSTENDTGTSTEKEEESAVKEEPAWLVNGYTQEPDTIFLSDDDEMVMSFSQPVINISDEDSSDFEVPVVDHVKKVKKEPIDDNLTSLFDGDGHSDSYSDDDWSDKGSDFEPESLFRNFQKISKFNKIKTSDNNDSNTTADEELNLKVKKENDYDSLVNTASSDGADNKNSTTPRHKTEKGVNDSVHITDENSDVGIIISSDDDEFLASCAFNIERKLGYNDTAGSSTSSKKEAIDKNTVNNKLGRNKGPENVSSGNESDEMEPYIQNTQIDPERRKEISSNNVSVFDFHSEHFSDVTENDSSTKERNISDDSDITILDLSNDTFIDDTQIDENPPRRNSRESLNHSDMNDTVFNMQTQIDIVDETSRRSDAVPLSMVEDISDASESAYNEPTQIYEERPFYTDISDIEDVDESTVIGNKYEVPTQVDKSFPKFEDISDADQSEAGSCVDFYDVPTQNDDVESHKTVGIAPVFEDVTDEDNVTDEGNESEGYKDPQMANYFGETQVDSSSHTSYINSVLNMKFVKFSDVSDASDEDVYNMATQADNKNVTARSNESADNSDVTMVDEDSLPSIPDDNLPELEDHKEQVDSTDSSIIMIDNFLNDSTSKIKHDSDVSDGKKNVTRIVENQEDPYLCATQIEGPKQCSSVSKNHGEKYPVDKVLNHKSETNKNAFFADTQTVTIVSEEEDNAFNAATQVDADICDNIIKEFTAETVNDANESVDKNNDFTAATQVDRIVHTDNNNVDFSAATQSDKNDNENNSDDDIDEFTAATQIDTDVLNDSNDIFNAATQIDGDVLSDENDEFTAATQVDADTIDDNAGGDFETYKVGRYANNDNTDDFIAATQIDAYAIDGENNDFTAATQIDPNVLDGENDDYTAATQVENFDKINVMNPIFVSGTSDSDVADSHKATKANDDGVIELNDSTDLDTTVGNLFERILKDTMPASSDLPSKTTKAVNKSINKTVQPATKCGLKRANSVRDTTAVTSDLNEGKSIPKKPRYVEVAQRQVLPTVPQKLKSIKEKRNSGVIITKSSKPASASCFRSDSNTDIEVKDATDKDMWLSKRIPPTNTIHARKKDSHPGKRKRQGSQDSVLAAKMAAAKSQLRERIMHTISKPEPISKRSRISRETLPDCDDVTLPSNSQIIGQGLPLLNPVGILQKNNTSKSSHTREVNVTVSSSSATTTTVTMSSSMSKSSSVVHSSVSTTKVSDAHNFNRKDTLESIGDKQSKKVTQSKKSNENENSTQRNKSDRKGHEKAKGHNNKHSSDRDDNPSTSRVSSSVTARGKENSKFHHRKDESQTRSTSKTSAHLDTKKQTDTSKCITTINSTISHVSASKSSQSNVILSDNTSLTAKKVSFQVVMTTNSTMSHTSVSPSKSSQSNVKPSNTTLQTAKSVTRTSSVDSIRSSKSSLTGSSSSSLSSSSRDKSKMDATSRIISRLTTVVSSSVKAVTTTAVTVTTSVCSNSRATTTTVSGSSKSSPAVRPTMSSHIQSSELLQKKQHYNNGGSVNIGSSSYQGPVASTSTSRHPFHPIQSNAQVGSEPLPVGTASHAKLNWHDFLVVMLKWNPLWFQEKERFEKRNEKISPPPITDNLCGKSNHQLFPLCGTYVDYQDYCENFMLPLLLHETWESCYSTWRQNKENKQVYSHEVCCSGLDNHKDTSRLKTYILYGLISEQDKRARRYVCERELVKLVVPGSDIVSKNETRPIKRDLMGYVDSVVFQSSVDRIVSHFEALGKKPTKGYLRMKMIVTVRSRTFVPSSKEIIHVQSISPIVNTYRQFIGLSLLPYSPLCQSILQPSSNLIYCDKAPPMVQLDKSKPYNESQSMAINTASKICRLSPDTPRVCLIQGPPGTGKSHTIVGIIMHILKDIKGPCRICLCAQSNAAVDELLKRLCRNKLTSKRKMNMVRMGKTSSVHKEIQDLCLDNLIERNINLARREQVLKDLPKSLANEVKSLKHQISVIKNEIKTASDFKKKKFCIDLKQKEKDLSKLESKYQVPRNTRVSPLEESKMRREILLKADIVAGTLSGIGSSVLQTCFQGIKQAFQVAIIDEATQAIELETLIPLQYGVSKLILVGDPKQLPPTVVSQVATENKFDVSLFERLDSYFKYSTSNVPNPVITLNVQYRMHPDIAAFPNLYIYDGKIENEKHIIERRKMDLSPYVLFDITEGREQFSQGSRSMCNILEAQFTVELCSFILSHTTQPPRGIGVIAPYSKQKIEVQKMLHTKRLDDVEVSTVDGFQGREKNIIVMTCVRANMTGSVGFVGKRNRMNVSLTRAKYAMYLVGHLDSLEASDEWKTLIQDAKTREKIIQVDRHNFTDSLRKVILS